MITIHNMHNYLITHPNEMHLIDFYFLNKHTVLFNVLFHI